MRTVSQTCSCMTAKGCVLSAVCVASWVLVSIWAISSGSASSFMGKLDGDMRPPPDGSFRRGLREIADALPMSSEYALPVVVSLTAHPGSHAEVTDPNGLAQQLSIKFHKAMNPCGNCTFNRGCAVQSVDGYHLGADFYDKRWLGTRNQSTILVVKICSFHGTIDGLYQEFDRIGALATKLAHDIPSFLDNFQEPKATALPWCLRETKAWIIRSFSRSDLLSLPLAIGIELAVIGPIAATVFITTPLTFGVAICILDHFTHNYTFSVLIPPLILTLALSLSLDYTLFILWRFESELSHLMCRNVPGRPREEVAVDALKGALMHAGYAVFCSGLLLVAVVQSFLLGSQTPMVQAWCLSVSVTVLVCLVVHLTLLPALILIIDRATKGAFFVCNCATSARSTTQNVCNNLISVGLRNPKTVLVAALLVSIVSLRGVLKTHVTAEQTALTPPESNAGKAWNEIVNSGVAPGVLAPSWLIFKRLPQAAPIQMRAGALTDSQQTTNASLSTAACMNFDAQAISAIRRVIHSDKVLATEKKDGILGMLNQNLVPVKCEMLQDVLDLCPKDPRSSRAKAVTWLRGYCPTICNGNCSNTRIEHLLHQGTFDMLKGMEDTARRAASEEAAGSPFLERWTFLHIGKFRGEWISSHDAKRFILQQEGEDQADLAEAYRQHFSSYANPATGTAVIEVHVPFDPLSGLGLRWIRRIRAEMMRNQDLCQGNSCGLFSMQNRGLDVQDSVWSNIPARAIGTCVTVVLFVGLVFKSILVPVRLLLTVMLTVLWTSFVMGWVCTRVWGLDGMYVLVVAFVMPVVIGLTLDYDLFLLISVLEHRKRGWSTPASVRQGLEETQMVISLAGLIMALTFSSLSLSGLYVVRQFGLLLVLGTMLDAFVMRPFIVPALVLALADAEVIWWPRQLPPIKHFELGGNTGDNGWNEIALDEMQGSYVLAEAG